MAQRTFLRILRITELQEGKKYLEMTTILYSSNFKLKSKRGDGYLQKEKCNFNRQWKE